MFNPISLLRNNTPHHPLETGTELAVVTSNGYIPLLPQSDSNHGCFSGIRRRVKQFAEDHPTATRVAKLTMGAAAIGTIAATTYYTLALLHKSPEHNVEQTVSQTLSITESTTELPECLFPRPPRCADEAAINTVRIAFKNLTECLLQPLNRCSMRLGAALTTSTLAYGGIRTCLIPSQAGEVRTWVLDTLEIFNRTMPGHCVELDMYEEGAPIPFQLSDFTVGTEQNHYAPIFRNVAAGDACSQDPYISEHPDLKVHCQD